MRDDLTLLAVGPSGLAVEDRLEKFGFRFDFRTREWRRVVMCHEMLPPRTTRSAVAAACGVPECVLERWEEATPGLVNVQEPNAVELLSVGPDGAVNPEPLISWSLRFYPRSGVWRRTRADRNEVDRGRVARKVGVDADLIAVWERALYAQIQRSGIAED